MRFLLDQDVYALTARFLRDLGHDIVTAAELGLARAADTDLLVGAAQESRIFVTRDKALVAGRYESKLGHNKDNPSPSSAVAICALAPQGTFSPAARQP